MKKILATLLVCTLTMATLAACGTSGETPSQTGEGAAEAKPVLLQIGYENNPGEPLDLGANKWKELAQTDGNIEIELFPSSQLGSKNDIIDQMIAGDSVMTLADGAFYADRGVKDFGIVFGPYLFEDWKECWTLTESDWYAEQSGKLEENGLKIVASNWIYGDRHTLTTKPVNKVEDLKGMKIRVPNNTIQVKGFEVLGATPTPMALGDVYTALQQGTIDGLENPLPVLYNGKFHEVAKYLVLDGHVKNFTTWVCGADFFNSLSDVQQKAIAETGKQAGEFNNELQMQAEAETIAKFKAEGVTVVELDDTAKEGFASKAKTFYSLPEFTSIWSANLYDTVKGAMK